MAKKIRNPKQRLRRVLDCCKGKPCIASPDSKDGADTEGLEHVKNIGCGAIQPTYTIDDLNIVAEFKLRRSRDEEQMPEATERKQVLFADKVWTSASLSFRSVHILVLFLCLDRLFPIF
jgi:DNA-directed RNA polymerase II subunit RPB1